MIHGKRLVVVMPAYNAEATIEKTLREIPAGFADDVVLVDDDDRIVIANSQLGRFFPAVAAELQPGARLSRAWSGELGSPFVP